MFAPPRRGDADTPRPTSRLATDGRHAVLLDDRASSASGELLPFLFADAEDDRQQYTMVVHNVTARLSGGRTPTGDGARDRSTATTVRTFHELVDLDRSEGSSDDDPSRRSVGRPGDRRRARSTRSSAGCTARCRHVEHSIRADVARPGTPPGRRSTEQVTVVDLHNLNDRAKRFVVGVVLRKAFEAKERAGTARPAAVRRARRAEQVRAARGHRARSRRSCSTSPSAAASLGIILIGAQQTASEVERRIIANSAIRVVGRLDAAEAGRGEYGFLPAVQRQRATILKPGTMIVSQPELPVPLVTEFPFPAWATRAAEAGPTRRPDPLPTTRSRACRADRR